MGSVHLHDQRACRPLDSGRGVRGGDWEILAHVSGLDVRHDCVSVPCLAHVIGFDVRNGSGEHSVGGVLFRRVL